MGGEEQDAFSDGIRMDILPIALSNVRFQKVVFPSPPDPLLPRNSD